MSASATKARGRTNRPRTANDVQGDHERRFDDAPGCVPPGPGAWSPFGLENIRLPEDASSLSGKPSLLPGVLAPELDDLLSEEAHLLALVHLDDSARLAVDPARVLRAGRRTWVRRDVVDPASACEHVVRVQVVGLPERPRVGRHREAADGDAVAGDPRRKHECRARADDEQRGEPVVGESEARHQPDAEDEREQEQARVAEDPQLRASRRVPQPTRASVPSRRR